MNINRSAHRLWLASLALAGALLLPGRILADVPAPDPIDNLTATTGGQIGSIILQWTARGDDLGVEPASRHLIRYRFHNPIGNETEWGAAYRVEEPPVSIVVSTPADLTRSANTNET